MTFSLEQNARAIFLPAFDSLDFDAVMLPFLDMGGRSVLLGETRAEYVARAMSKERLSSETPEMVRGRIDVLKNHCPEIIVAVDQELGGIQRLEGLVPRLPPLPEALSLSANEIAEHCFVTATAARALGVTMFLAPIVDVIDGQNPWLENRTMGTDAPTVAMLAAAYISGVQRAGVTAVTKHFPGFNNLTADPALVDVALTTPLDRIRGNAEPFIAAIRAGTGAIMTGPAPVVAIDAHHSASTSAAVVSLLRNQFGFEGLIVSDDLDAPATLRGGSLLKTAIDALNAGVDLLLVAGGPHLNNLCEGIVAAVTTGVISHERLADAAGRVRSMTTV